MPPPPLPPHQAQREGGGAQWLRLGQYRQQPPPLLNHLAWVPLLLLLLPWVLQAQKESQPQQQQRLQL